MSNQPGTPPKKIMAPDDVRKLEEQHHFYERRGAEIAQAKADFLGDATKDWDKIPLNIRNMPHWTPEIDERVDTYLNYKAFNRIKLMEGYNEWISRCKHKETEILLDILPDGRPLKVTMDVPEDDANQTTTEELKAASFARRYLRWIKEIWSRRDIVRDTTLKVRNWPIPEIYADEAIITGDGEGRDRRVKVREALLQQQKEVYAKMKEQAKELEKLRKQQKEGDRKSAGKQRVASRAKSPKVAK